MSSIHYFQRYSQPENVATNNTLLLLSRLYQHSPNYFKGFLNELLDDTDLEAGILFNQQEKGKGSIPDANIRQSSFKVAVETKMHQKFSITQLTNHLTSFTKEETKILLSLSPKLPRPQLKQQIQTEIEKFNQANQANIKYIDTTFQTIVEKVRNVLQPHDYELMPIVDDFESYCIHDKLITDDEYRMRVVTCGWTLNENFAFDIYYDRVDDGYSDHSYVGLYSNKSVKGIGKLSNIIEADLQANGTLLIKNKLNPVTPEQEKNIIGIIAAAKQNNNWDVTRNHNFFCVEKFYETDFKKTSKFPLQGTKFFNLKNILEVNKLPEPNIIAALLKERNWEGTAGNSKQK